MKPLLLAVLLCGALSSQAQKSLLWRVEKDGHPISYIFGTMHLICKPDFEWKPSWERRLKSCQNVCFELDLSNTDAMTQAAAWFRDPSGRGVGSYFAPGDYELVEAYITKNLGVPVPATAPLKPLALESLLLAKSTCDSPVFYEDFIRQKAVAAGQKIYGIEKPEDQFRALETLPTDSVVGEIMEFVRHPETSQAEFGKMVKAYKAEDIESLQAIASTEGMTQGSTGPLLTQRNQAWVPRMIRRMNEGSVFFAVGAAHLGGEQGILELLRNEGYRVSMVLSN